MDEDWRKSYLQADHTPPSGTREWRDGSKVCWPTYWLHVEADGDLDGFRKCSFKLDVHHGSRQSGGPMYYTPNLRWWIVGVHGGHSTTGALNDSLKGAKVPFLKDSIINVGSAL